MKRKTSRAFRACLIVFGLLTLAINNLQAGSNPNAHYGKYGIHYNSDINSYQQYVGRTIIYYPSKYEKSDIQMFENNKGRFNTPYTIKDVSTISTREKQLLVFELQEKENSNHAQFYVLLQGFDLKHIGDCFDWSMEFYRDSDLPLFLMDEFENDKKELIGKDFINRQNSSNESFQITDMMLQTEKNYDYPVPYIEITNQRTNTKSLFRADDLIYQEELGLTFSNELIKGEYTVVGIIKDYNSYPHLNNQFLIESADYTTKYIVNNQELNLTKEVFKYNAQETCFKDDYKGTYKAKLAKVQNTSTKVIVTKKIKEISEDIFIYQDNYIDYSTFVTETAICFTIENRSNSSLKINWNEAVYVDYCGSTSKIMHDGIKYSNRNGDQPVTTIIQEAKLEDEAIPTNNVFYSESTNSWVKKPLIPNGTPIENCRIKLMLPIISNNKTNEYVFEYELTYQKEHPERFKISQ